MVVDSTPAFTATTGDITAHITTMATGEIPITTTMLPTTDIIGVKNIAETLTCIEKVLETVGLLTEEIIEHAAAMA